MLTEPEIEEIFENFPPKEAFRKLLTLAENGHPVAQFYLAELYGLGETENKDNTKAFEWYSKSAASNYARAHHYLAVCFDRGIGCEQNTQKAREHFQRAAMLGYKPALEALNNLKNEI